MKLLRNLFRSEAEKKRLREDRDSRQLQDRLTRLKRLVGDDAQPNVNALWEIARDLDVIKLNLKFFGYELARSLAAALPVRQDLKPCSIPLESKASTQRAIESDWAAYWAAQLQIPLVFHRKIWEFAYVLQTLQDSGLIRDGTRGLGFGCGVEPLPSYLASRGVTITATDMPSDASRAQGWQDSNQHASSLAQLFMPHLVGQEAFAAHVSLEYVDMTDIPSTLRGFDFAWSICAFEHLGSIENGLRFLEASLATLRPGGVAVHTTEFNFANDDQTVDNWPTVLFQKRHFEAVAQRLTAQGHVVAPLNFDIGDQPLDQFIDMPPFAHDWNPYLQRQWGVHHPHIKIAVEGFPSTCFGITIRKDEGAAAQPVRP